MQQTTDRAATLIGFAIRAGKAVFGTDSIERMRQKKYLLLVCETLSDNALKKVFKHAGGVVVLCRKGRLQDVVHREGCKAAAITDRQMAEAILRETDRDNKYVRLTEVR